MPYHGGMSWTDEQLDSLKRRVAEGKRQGTWLSAAESALVSTLIWTVRRLTLSKGWSGVPEGRLPTIADTRRQGISAIYVSCAGPRGCGSRRRLALDELDLPETAIFVEIPKLRRFRCIRCGNREVLVMGDWPSGLGGLKRDPPPT